MKSLSLNQIPILLDTTYIMPIIGIDVEDIEEALTTLRELYSHDKIKNLLYAIQHTRGNSQTLKDNIQRKES